MPYRGPQPQRQQAQRVDLFQHDGEPVTLKAFVSAAGGVPAAGLGQTPYYVQHTVTAMFFGAPGFAQSLPEHQAGQGMIAEGRFMVTTREKLGTQDILVWRGTAYRVDGDSVPNHIAGTHSTIVKRGT